MSHFWFLFSFFLFVSISSSQREESFTQPFSLPDASVSFVTSNGEHSLLSFQLSPSLLIFKNDLESILETPQAKIIFTESFAINDINSAVSNYSLQEGSSPPTSSTSYKSPTNSDHDGVYIGTDTYVVHYYPETFQLARSCFVSNNFASKTSFINVQTGLFYAPNSAGTIINVIDLEASTLSVQKTLTSPISTVSSSSLDEEDQISWLFNSIGAGVVFDLKDESFSNTFSLANDAITYKLFAVEIDFTKERIYVLCQKRKATGNLLPHLQIFSYDPIVNQTKRSSNFDVSSLQLEFEIVLNNDTHFESTALKLDANGAKLFIGLKNTSNSNIGYWLRFDINLRIVMEKTLRSTANPPLYFDYHPTLRVNQTVAVITSTSITIATTNTCVTCVCPFPKQIATCNFGVCSCPCPLGFGGLRCDENSTQVPVFMTFEGIPESSQVSDFYASSSVYFEDGAINVVMLQNGGSGNEACLPSGTNCMVVLEKRPVMNVQKGFLSISFSYSSPDHVGSVSIYSEVGGKGELIQKIELTPNQNDCTKFNSNYYCFWTRISYDLEGKTGKSAVFAGYPNKIVFDDVELDVINTTINVGSINYGVSLPCNTAITKTKSTPPKTTPITIHPLTVFAIDGGYPNLLYSIDPSSLNYTTNRISGLKTAENLLSLSQDRSTGLIWSISNQNNLYLVDPIRTVAQFSSQLLCNVLQSNPTLFTSFDPTTGYLHVSTLIPSSTGVNRYIISVQNGSCVRSSFQYSTINSPIVSSAGISFDPNGKLYFINRLPAPQLTSTDASGTLTPIGDLGVPLSGVGGFDIQSTYGIASFYSLNTLRSDLYRVDLSSGSATLLGSFPVVSNWLGIIVVRENTLIEGPFVLTSLPAPSLKVTSPANLNDRTVAQGLLSSDSALGNSVQWVSIVASIAIALFI